MNEHKSIENKAKYHFMLLIKNKFDREMFSIFGSIVLMKIIEAESLNETYC